MTAATDRPGLAILVKTPGLSPVKTRLAAGIGREAAETFHRLSAGAVSAVAREAADALDPAWAVAEAAGLSHPLWRGLPVLSQGEGGLGERMARVHAALLAGSGAGLLIGADSPQATPGLLRRAALALSAAPYVLGPAADGGFWLVGGRVPVPEAAWTGTPYARPDTGALFLGALRAAGEVVLLPTLADADEAGDLPGLREALAALEDPLPEQSRLLGWLRALPA